MMVRERVRRAKIPVLTAILCLILAVSGGCTSFGTQRESDEKRVLLCHDGSATLKVPRSKVEEHLDHGDALGPCR
ncbi:MAG: hypothetical protein SX243_02700 [Acidobacteriota bacterium]|nr:hypothetical protein [Acidobacteriota bacterium]